MAQLLGAALVLGAVSCSLLDVHDLLSPALSPAALLGTLPPPPRHQGNQSATTVAGLSNALGTMLYHRSKMNEYLCHNYLAEEILTDLTPLQSRSDGPEEKRPKALGQDSLLKDQGSASYKEWLDKSAQLQEMYTGGKGASPHGFETGDVTGYATMAGGKGDPWPAGGGSTGWQDYSGEEVTGWGWEEEESGKGLALKELFDLALTALAFLAFGLFILNLVMTCFAKTPNMTVVMPVTTTEATGRRRRDAESERLNELAYRVLTSIDRLLELQEQPDRAHAGCLAYALCDNNRYSRALADNNRIWMPVWSLGMSWFAGRQRGDHLRASVLGLGDADCSALYPRCAPTRHGPS